MGSTDNNAHKQIIWITSVSSIPCQSCVYYYHNKSGSRIAKTLGRSGGMRFNDAQVLQILQGSILTQNSNPRIIAMFEKQFSDTGKLDIPSRLLACVNLRRITVIHEEPSGKKLTEVYYEHIKKMPFKAARMRLRWACEKWKRASHGKT
jgi:hypothetical protein